MCCKVLFKSLVVEVSCYTYTHTHTFGIRLRGNKFLFSQTTLGKKCFYFLQIIGLFWFEEWILSFFFPPLSLWKQKEEERKF